MNRIDLVSAVLLVVLAAAPQRLAAQDAVTYDMFMSLDSNERLARFGQLAPENQADLQREHLSRWRKLRADSLTDEKQKFLDEVVASIRPENYAPGRPHRTDQEVQAFMDLSRRADALFSAAELSEWSTLRNRLILPQ
jgi:hypothetical protein